MHLLEIKNLSMYYEVSNKWIKAVDDISLTLDKGRSLGIVGESGCGKTSLVASIMRLLPINGKIIKGNIYFEGEDILKLSPEEFRTKYRWKKMSIIFQNSMSALNPVFTVKNQIMGAIKLHENISDQEAHKKTLKLLELVGLSDSIIDNYPHELSGGMKQRVMIALSLICTPELLIADEPITALDVIVQDQIINEIKNLQKKLNIAMIFVSHDISTIFETCEKIIVMYGGKIVEYADAVSLFKDTRHPYTMGLLKSFPSIHGDLEQLISIPGSPPDLLNPPKGCRFHPRCKFTKQICTEKDPPLVEIVPNEHYSLCHFALSGRMKY